jgi:hypothetical protein
MNLAMTQPIEELIAEVEQIQQKREERHLRRVLKGTAAKPRPTCRCPAYPWPHRRRGGLCRYPDPPAESWNGRPGKNLPTLLRRTSSVRRRLLSKHDLHPIRDREKIRRWLPKLYVAYWRRLGWWIGPDVPAMRVTAETPVCVQNGHPCQKGRLWWA